jgi:hypothetical protein
MPAMTTLEWSMLVASIYMETKMELLPLCVNLTLILVGGFDLILVS